MTGVFTALRNFTSGKINAIIDKTRCYSARKMLEERLLLQMPDPAEIFIHVLSGRRLSLRLAAQAIRTRVH